MASECPPRPALPVWTSEAHSTCEAASLGATEPPRARPRGRGHQVLQDSKSGLEATLGTEACGSLLGISQCSLQA